MKTENKEILGFVVPVVGIAETLSEAITAAGSEEAVLKDFNSNVLAHSHYTILRRAIVKTLVGLTGIKQLTEKDGDKDVVSEKDGDYLTRLRAELGEDVIENYAADIAKVCAAIKVDYTPGVRGSGNGGKPAKKWLDAVEQIIKEGKWDSLLAKSGLDVDQPEDDLKIAAANWIKDIVLAAQVAAAKTALAI